MLIYIGIFKNKKGYWAFFGKEFSTNGFFIYIVFALYWDPQHYRIIKKMWKEK